MEIVERAEYSNHLFACVKCKKMIRAVDDDFGYVKKGQVSYCCPKCDKRLIIKEKKITTIPVYLKVKEPKKEGQ